MLYRTCMSAENQPSELNQLREVVKEFVSKLEAIDNEVETLKQDRKELIESYKSKLDIKTLNAVLRVLKIKQQVAHKDTFDAMIEVLEEGQ